MTVRNLDALIRAQTVLLLGAATSLAQQQLQANLAASLPAGRRPSLPVLPAGQGLPRADLAVLFDAALAGEGFFAALGAAGIRALIWAAPSPPSPALLNAARPHLVRVLGPRTAGVIHPARGYNASTLPLTPQSGTVALIAQSQSVAAAALDWAVGRGVGFSWLAVTGGEADVDVADLLDHAALDPQTRAVVLQLGRIRQPRKFMSAARAAARVKPVLVLQTRRADSPGGPDPVRSAAFQRAGLVECETLGALFDGLATLELLPRVSGERVAVLGNGWGVCALGVDAVRRQGLQVVRPSPATREQIARERPGVRDAVEALDFGSADAATVVHTLRAVLADRSIDAALLVHAPQAGQPHQALAQAIVEAELGDHLMTVWLGLHSAQPARQSSAQARLSTFVSADAAVRALRYRVLYRRTREMLGQTPPPDPLASTDAAGVEQRLAALDPSQPVSEAETRATLAAYGLGAPPSGVLDDDAPALRLRLEASLHPELGMVLRVKQDPSALQAAAGYGLPPLDPLLARRLLQTAGISEAVAPAAVVDAAVAALIRVGQLLIDQRRIARLEWVTGWTAAAQVLACGPAHIRLLAEPLPERQRMALAPYPEPLAHAVTVRQGRRYAVRAVRPADEPAVLRLLARLDPEEIRLRFFAYIRYFSHDMAARVTQVDYDRELSLIASAEDEPGEIAAIATLVADPDGVEAEYAVLVHHDHARQGLGRHLLERLLALARARGVGAVHGDVLGENTAMLTLARRLGFSIRVSEDDPGCRTVRIVTTP